MTKIEVRLSHDQQWVSLGMCEKVLSCIHRRTDNGAAIWQPHILKENSRTTSALSGSRS